MALLSRSFLLNLQDDKAGSSPGAAHDSDMENGAATDLQKLGAKPGKQVPGLTPRAALYRPSSKITSFLVGVVLSAAILGFSSGLFGSGLSQKRATYQWDLSTKEDYPDLFGYIDPTSFPADEVLQYDGYSRQTLKSIRSYWKSFYPPANPPIYFAGNDTLGPDKEIDSLQVSPAVEFFGSGLLCLMRDVSEIWAELKWEQLVRRNRQAASGCFEMILLEKAAETVRRRGSCLLGVQVTVASSSCDAALWLASLCLGSNASGQ